MRVLWVILLGAFLSSGLSGLAEVVEDKADFTLVNKHDLAERKKKWQKAVTEKAILARENEKMTAAMEAHSDELDLVRSKLDSANRNIRKYKKLVDQMIYQQPRIWKSNGGKALQAILIEDDGEAVRLRTGLESEVSIARGGLSKRDIQLLDQLRDIEDSADSVEDEELSEEDGDAPEENKADLDIQQSLKSAL